MYMKHASSECVLCNVLLILQSFGDIRRYNDGFQSVQMHVQTLESSMENHQMSCYHLEGL